MTCGGVRYPPPTKPRPFDENPMAGRGRAEVVRVVSSVNPQDTIVVEDMQPRRGGYALRTLRFEAKGCLGAVQSAELLGPREAGAGEGTWGMPLAYQQAMLAALAFRRTPGLPPRRVTIFGLGAGTMARWLLQTYDSVHVRAVEVDQSVVDVAERCFGLPWGSAHRLDVEVCSAIDVVSHRSARHARADALFVDIGNRGGGARDGLAAPDPALLTVEAFAALRSMLSEDGVLAINVVARGSRHARRRVVREAFGRMSAIFRGRGGRSLRVHTAEGNVVLMGSRQAPDMWPLQRACDLVGGQLDP